MQRSVRVHFLFVAWWPPVHKDNGGSDDRKVSLAFKHNRDSSLDDNFCESAQHYSRV